MCIRDSKGGMQMELSGRLRSKYGFKLTDEERGRFLDDGYVLWTMMR